MRRISVLFSLSLLLLTVGTTLALPKRALADWCSDLTKIPVTVNPAQGEYTDRYTITIHWDQIPNADYNSYRTHDLQLEISKSKDNSSPVTTAAGTFFKINDTFNPEKPAPLSSVVVNNIINNDATTLYIRLEDPNQVHCRVDDGNATITLKTQGKLAENAKNGNTSLAVGAVCDPKLQGNDPVETCAKDLICACPNGTTTCEAGTQATCQKLETSPTPLPPPCPPEAYDSSSGHCSLVHTGLGFDIKTDPAGFVESVFGFLLGISGGIALLLIIYSGYQMVMSRGKPETLQAARDRLTSAIVGLLFLIFSLAILQIIGVDILHIPGFDSSIATNGGATKSSNLNLPQTQQNR